MCINIDGIDPFNVKLNNEECFLHVFVKKGSEILFGCTKRMERPTDEIEWEGLRKEVNELQDYFKAVKIENEK